MAYSLFTGEKIEAGDVVYDEAMIASYEEWMRLEYEAGINDEPDYGNPLLMDRIGQFWFDYEDAAKEILEHGLAFGYMYDTWQSLHIGDSHVGKCLISTIPQSSMLNSKGVHVSIAGEGGKGKSDCQDKALELIPDEYKFAGDITPQALFYSGEFIHPGMIICIDDILWNDGFGNSIKKITSYFQKDTKKATVKSCDGACGVAPERLTFWVSQVDMQADEQIRDRFILVEVDNSPEHNAEVLSFMGRQASGRAPTEYDLKDRIRICQDIVRLIRREEPFNVVVPFAERIAFTGDPRAFRMFLDIIKAFTVFRYPIRDIDAKVRLVATEEDFKDAAELYEAMGGIDRDKFSKRELKVLQAIRDNGNSATYVEIGEAIGEGYQTVRNIILGRRDNPQQSYGLAEKCGGKMTLKDSRPVKIHLDPAFTFRGFSVELVKREETNS